MILMMFFVFLFFGACRTFSTYSRDVFRFILFMIFLYVFFCLLINLCVLVVVVL